MNRNINLGLTTLVSLTLSLSAQQVAEGYSNGTNSLAAGAGNVLVTSLGTVYFDGNDLMKVDGNSSQSLLTFASYTFGSFTSPIGSNKVLFGESSNGGIWSVPLNGGSPQLVANVAFNYDAVLLDDDRALISAKTGGFAAANNDVMFVDLLTGQTQLLAQFPGASGPLAIDDAGDVYYATSSNTFPAPPGTVDVLKLSRAAVDGAILSNQVLGVADATLIVQGLDAAGDLAFDDDGDLFFVDWFNGRIGEINDADTAQATVAPALIDYAGAAASGTSLQFLPPASAAAQVFEPFQPAGGALLIRETDYGSVNQIRTLAAAPAVLTASAASPIPAGAFSFDIQSGPAGGLGLVLFASGTLGGPVSLSVPGFEAGLLVDASLATAPIVSTLFLDAAGAASLSLNNPGFATSFAAAAQPVVISTTGAIAAGAAQQFQIGL
ncbi:MAG: hypothetical protein VYA51_06065 [Planctomycetota bacterium]|nr:hypothetical protein [Planctomycetota bacterium]